jgi:HAD superfamily phosphoserine phosphatase-like hydrolase
LLKVVFLDFSRTLAKGSGMGAGAELMGKGGEYKRLYYDFLEKKLSEGEYVSRVLPLWKGVSKEQVKEISKNIEFNEGAVEVVSLLRAKGIASVIVSFAPLQLMERVAERVGASAAFGTECVVGRNGFFTGKIKGVEVNKGKVVRKVLRQLNLSRKEAMAVGDSRNDASMFAEVEYSIAYNASGEVRKKAKKGITRFEQLIPLIDKLS